MKQILLCIMMLICSVFMYSVVSMLESAAPTSKTGMTGGISIAESGVYQK